MEGDVGPEHRITSPREVEARREAVWDAIVRKHIPKAHKQRQQSVTVREYNAKKTAQMCAQQARRMTLVLRRTQKELAARQRKLTKEMQVFWRKNEKEERERQKRAEKERQDALRREEEAREARRQQKKLNFLIQQTELYAHFVAKIQDKSGAQPASQPAAVAAGDGAAGPADGAVNFKDINFDEESDEALAKRAEQSALAAFDRTKERTRAFDNETAELRRADGEMNFQNPTMLPSAVEVTQPEMLTCKLKAYQMKGLNWLVNLWESGINGILADEMGLGKTVQSISVLAYLAEVQNIWGPYLVIAPLSTLHNWQQELEKFTPSLKVLPYWGKAADRKVLRKFWARKKLYTKDAAFHVLITSYQIVAQDEKYFQKIKWQYMILDEAQAIKSSDSLRWKQLQKLHARNRLLLTGTPIQNSMQELWALLHFIMPTLFDSHEEFSEWFSKDIEGSAQDMNTLNEHQLKRLHMILRPFMLRRVKRDVENELGEKVEIDVPCALTPRQKKLYKGLREKLSVADLLDRISSLGEKDSSDNLMNLVMQFRKVCNHPELFERAPVESPMVMFRPGDQLPDLGKTYPTDSLIGRPEASPIELRLPRALYESGLVDVGGIGSAPVGDPSRGKVLDHLFNIFHPLHVTESLARGDADFGFLRFADLSPADANRISKEDALRRVLQLLVDRKDEQRRAVFEELQENVEPAGNRSEVSSRLLIAPQSPFTAENLSSSDVLRDLCTVSVQIASESRLRREAPAYKPMVLAAPVDVVCSSKSFVNRMDDAFWEATPRALLSGTEGLLPGGPSNPRNKELVRVIRDETNGRGLIGETDTTQGFSHIWIPEPEKMIYDSGKLLALDSLLPKLKAEGHRVLIFFQMVRMMDLIEEYLTFRNYQYLRLDGQTAVQERNMMVREFQTNPDVFIFILSTRAGGLGINLTAADTVIFYDSDWNPTVDQQAMDRCHRLGQTRQVTVYRLISIGTIEERILKRAKQKDHVQKVVISGGGFQQQVEFKPRDIAALLLDDDELEANLKKRQAERAREEERLKTRGRPAGTDTGDANGKRKREGDGTDPGTPESTPAPVSKKRRRAAQSWAKEELAEAQGAGDAPKAAPKPRVRKPKKPATPADGKGAAGGASAIPALPDSASGKENGAIQLD
ncbi:SNF2 family N-terminal domain-containing protein [Hyaloraphidium curvatum]|nr:SNF2 family N-terminal domain-containing protein [Hyaloraphidium curvatum]